MANASASVFYVSVDNQYGNEHNDHQKLTFIGEVGSLQISIISLHNEIRSFQERMFWLKMFGDTLNVCMNVEQEISKAYTLFS